MPRLSPGLFFWLPMPIPLEELVQRMPIVSMLAMVLVIVARPLTWSWERLPLFWRGAEATKELRLNSAPLEVDIDHLPRKGLVRRIYEWTAEARSGRTQLSFDDWLTCMALPANIASAGIIIRQRDLTFLLQHGRRYVITDPDRGIRVFECRIDERLPIVAFVDATGRRGPWLTLPKLLTIEEIVSLRPTTPP